MTVEQVKEQVKKLTGEEISDEKAQALMDEHDSGEISDRELGAVSGGVTGSTAWWYTFHCWGCQWDGTAPTLADAEKKHREQCPGCSRPEIIQAPEPIPEWLANPSAEDLATWGI